MTPSEVCRDSYAENLTISVLYSLDIVPRQPRRHVEARHGIRIVLQWLTINVEIVSQPRVRLVNHVLRPYAAVLLEPQDQVVDAVGLDYLHQRKPSAHAIGKLRTLLKTACGSQYCQGSHRPFAAIGIRYQSRGI